MRIFRWQDIGPERLVLIGLGVSTFSLWLFIQLAEEVIEGDSTRFDEWLVNSLRNPSDPALPFGPGWLREAMRDITALGSTSVLFILTLAAVGFMILKRDRRAALWTLIAVFGGTLLSLLLKEAFDRPRPEILLHMNQVYTSSFPSGHAMMSAVVYLTLGALLAAHQRSRRLKLYLLVLPVILTLLVGVSRVYLGVHWPTDVLAGWAMGAAWAAGCWSLDIWLQARGQVEQPHAMTDAETDGQF